MCNIDKATTTATTTNTETKRKVKNIELLAQRGERKKVND